MPWIIHSYGVYLWAMCIVHALQRATATDTDADADAACFSSCVCLRLHISFFSSSFYVVVGQVAMLRIFSGAFHRSLFFSFYFWLSRMYTLCTLSFQPHCATVCATYSFCRSGPFIQFHSFASFAVFGLVYVDSRCILYIVAAVEHCIFLCSHLAGPSFIYYRYFIRRAVLLYCQHYAAI